MNSIEMTDLDGDALTLITREERTWITCTSGTEEVTVGPFPTRLVQQMLTSDSSEERTATLLMTPWARSTPASGQDVSTELADELREVTISLDDPDALAEHIVSLGWRRD